ncbi:MAG: hypothetical protein ABSG01_13530 [Anaerolineales bacterium]|jgi:nucleotide-binding universal stress UspA family protein
MKNKYAEIEKILRKMAQARIDSRQAVAKLEASGKDYNAEYVKNFIVPKIEQAKDAFAALSQTSEEKVALLLADLQQLATEKQAKLDLSNPAWANALALIQLSGKDIDADTVRKINAQFANDQPALRALKQIYKNAGVLYDGGISDMLYEPEATFENLRNWEYHAFHEQGGSLNEFANAIRQVASKEGIDFPEQVDSVGADNAMRMAAGLPVN